MQLHLITYRSEDGLELDGAYYTASESARASDPLVVLIHGAWMNFYTGPQRHLPEFLVPAGFDCLAINTRDHDLGGIHPPTGRCFGMLRSRFREIIPDLTGALEWGRDRGYERFILVCHSYSAPRGAFFLARQQEKGIEAIAMLSPAAGLRSVSRYWMDDWESFEKRVRQLVETGRGEEVVVERPGGRFPIIASAQTALDIWVENPLEDSSFMEGLTTPLLITIGEKETAQEQARRNFERIASVWKGPVTAAIIPDSGHYYDENPEGLATILLPWILEGAPRSGSDMPPDGFSFKPGNLKYKRSPK